MNYRHAYHAGNFADVLKHVVLTRIVDYLKRKPGAFRVIDTHAGPGRYDLSSEEAARTGEWRDGIARMLAAPSREAAARDLLAPYLEAVGAIDGGGAPAFYPGSPLITRRLLRPVDRLTAIELHPLDAASLRTLFSGDVQVRVIALDGWLALGAHVPPKERRGLVLVDPPFETPGEFERLAGGLARAHRRWPGGTYALWYPVKDRAAVAGFRDALRSLAIPATLDIVLETRGPSGGEPRLDGCGVVVVNPPHVLEGEMAVLLPALRSALARDPSARAGTTWLVPAP